MSSELKNTLLAVSISVLIFCIFMTWLGILGVWISNNSPNNECICDSCSCCIVEKEEDVNGSIE